jgi:hypothetical protein
MASPAAQSKAQALNAKLETEAKIMLDELDKNNLRKVARESHVCALKCYDKAGSSGSPEALEQCVRTCQTNHQQANAYVQNVSHYSDQLHRLVIYIPTVLSLTIMYLFYLLLIALQEVGQFQKRLNRSMEECQDVAKDLMQPGYENDAKKMAMVEDKLISCIAKTVDSHIALLKPMKARIIAQLK